MHTNKKNTPSLKECINHTVNTYRLSEAAAEALFYDEKSGKLPIGLSVTKAKTYRKFTVIFQSSDEQHSKKSEPDIPAACLNNIHSRKLELNLTQESNHKAWRDNLIRNTRPSIYKYVPSFFSSFNSDSAADDKPGEKPNDSDSAADDKPGEKPNDSDSAANSALFELELTSFGS